MAIRLILLFSDCCSWRKIEHRLKGRVVGVTPWLGGMCLLLAKKSTKRVYPKGKQKAIYL